jgi:S-adenosyl methyltransferase
MPGHDLPPGIRSSQEDLLDIDTSAAHPARVYDYWLGGTAVQRMFCGFTLVPPGLVPLDEWHPELGDTGTGLRSTAHSSVARRAVLHGMFTPPARSPSRTFTQCWPAADSPHGHESDSVGT